MFGRSLIFVLLGLFSFTQLNAQNSNYLNQNWLLADITYLNAEKATNIPARYDVKNKVLEIKQDDQITTVSTNEIKNLVFTEIDLFLSFSYSEKKLKSVSHAKEMARLIGTKKEGVIPTPDDHYLNKSWRVASITFDTDKNLYNALVKYNLKAKTLEIKQMNKTLSLPATRVNKFIFTQENQTFVSLKKYDNRETLFMGLISVFHSNGDFSLASYQRLKEASSLGGDVGYGSIETVEKKYKTTEEFCFIDAEDKLVKIERKAKKNVAFFGEHWEVVSAFVKKEKLSFKNKTDLIKILDFYSNLVNV